MRTNPLWTLLLGLVACGDPPDADGGQFGQEAGDGYACVEVERVPLAADEVSPLGFSPQALTTWAIATHTAPLTWNDGTTTDFSVDLSAPGSADYVTYTAETVGGSGGGSGIEPAIAMECSDFVEVTVDAHVQTADGALDESFSFVIQADSSSVVALSMELDGLTGTFDPWDWTTESYDDVWADLAVQLHETSGVSGEISGSGEATSGSGPDGTVSLTRFEIATIGSGGEAD